MVTNLSSSYVAGVGWLSWTAAESLRAFVEGVFANFRDKNMFTIDRKQSICGSQGTLDHTHRHVPSNTLFDVKIYTSIFQCRHVPSNAHLDVWICTSIFKCSPKALWKLSESRLSERSPKNLWKLPKALWKLFERSPKASSPKGSLKALWKLSESRLTFVENPSKASWLLLKALPKQEDFRRKLYESLSKSA